MAGIQKSLPAPEHDGSSDRPRYFYERLMQVTVKNRYYPLPNLCSDLTAAPTVASSRLMTDIGLLFLAEPTGFSVVYDANRRTELLAYLCRHRTPHGDWTRLSFELALQNMFFANFTRVPTDLDPTTLNYYVSNQNAHEDDDGAVLLSRGKYVRAGALVEITGPQYPVVVAKNVERVRVLDISGERVLHEDRCELGKCRATIYLAFTGLPEDKYLVQKIGYDGAVLEERNVLYVATGQYLFIDLLFSKPTPVDRGIYPVRDLCTDAARIETVHYDLVFGNRSTWWRYYVVLPPKSKADTLAIVTEPPGVMTFSGPTPVIIGNAQPAWRFVADGALKMTQAPPAQFTLTSSIGPLMESMPVASIKQILPEAEPPPRVYSDIYVYV